MKWIEDRAGLWTLLGVIVSVLGVIVPVVILFVHAEGTPEDKAVYSPPEKPGDIYIVINKTKKELIKVFITWGAYKEKREIDVSGYRGVVLKLTHRKYDSYPLEIRAEGEISSIKQYDKKEELPEQWINSNKMQYKKVSW